MAVSHNPLFQMRGTYLCNIVLEIDPEKAVAMSTLKKCPYPVKYSIDDAVLGFVVLLSSRFRV